MMSRKKKTDEKHTGTDGVKTSPEKKKRVSPIPGTDGETSGEDRGSASSVGEQDERLSNLQAEIDRLNEKYLRLMAEYDNYRKRTERERENLIRTASEELMRELLPILDNLDMATMHRNDTTTYEEYVKGIALIEDQFRNVLAKAGLEPMEAVGRKFDPTIHDAVGLIDSDDHESGVIIAEQQKGYVLSGKVIRHPQVIVSK